MVDKTVNEQEQKATGETGEAEAIFDEAAGEAAPDGEQAEGTPVKEGDTGEEQAKQDGDTRTPEGGEQPNRPDTDTTEKRLSDTQAWGTKLAQENARLQAELQSMRQQGQKPAGEKPVAAQEKVSMDQLKAQLTQQERDYLDDYPEVGGLLLKMLNQMPQPKAQPFEGLDEIRAQIEDTRFQQSVIGGFVSQDGKWQQGHPDFLQVIYSDEYQGWMADQVKSDPTLADRAARFTPAEAIAHVTRYKDNVAARKAADHDKATREKVGRFASGSVKPGTTTRGDMGRGGDASPEEIFEAAIR